MLMVGNVKTGHDGASTAAPVIRVKSESHDFCVCVCFVDWGLASTHRMLMHCRLWHSELQKPEALSSCTLS